LVRPIKSLIAEDINITVNVSALKIHMSENAHDALMAFPEFITECRGDISVKVKAATFILKITFYTVYHSK